MKINVERHKEKNNRSEYKTWELRRQRKKLTGNKKKRQRIKRGKGNSGEERNGKWMRKELKNEEKQKVMKK